MRTVVAWCELVLLLVSGLVAVPLWPGPAALAVRRAATRSLSARSGSARSGPARSGSARASSSRSPRLLALYLLPVLTLAASAALAVADRGAVVTHSALVLPVSVLTAVAAGGPVTAAVLDVADRSGEVDAGVGDGRPALRGGAWIGALERVAIAVTLLAGWPEGLAVVLGIKGLARYPELREPAAAERFIIGTFSSVLWAAAAAGAGRLLLR